MPSESSSAMSEPRPARRDAEVGGGGTAIWHSAFPEQVLDGDITLEPPGQSCTNQLPQPGPAGNHQQRSVFRTSFTHIESGSFSPDICLSMSSGTLCVMLTRGRFGSTSTRGSVSTMLIRQRLVSS